MVVVYTEETSPRFTYTCTYVFEHILQTTWQQVGSSADFEQHTGAKIDYSDSQLSEGTYRSSSLLFEKGCVAYSPVFKGDKLFLESNQVRFDLFAAIFFLLSRYEEYLNPKYDKHGRYLPENSVLYKSNFLKTPIVDCWLNQFTQELNTTFNTNFKTPKYQFISTVDLDTGFKYLHKGFVRTLGALAKDVLSLNVKQFTARVATIVGFSNDPFAIYSWLAELHKQAKVPLLVFVLNAAYNNYDRSLPQNSNGFKRVFKALAGQASIGIHPSYNSHTDTKILEKEITGLAELSEQIITISRQHFLKFSLPESLLNISAQGIQVDYSMAYASECGFRAGTSRSFCFYNLKNETATDLVLQPTAFMEGTFKDYKKLSSEKALEEAFEMVAKLKELGGTMVSIWHEAQLSEESEWRAAYQKLIAYAKA